MPAAQAELERKRREEEQRIARSGNNVPAPVEPPLPPVESKFTKSKAQRLAELLEKYRRDQISPAEYHSQRAKILAEPSQ